MGEHTIPPLLTPGTEDLSGWKMHWRRFRGFSWRDFRGVLTTTLSNWYVHNVPRLGASLAFYTLLSLAPLMVIVVAVAGAVFGRDAAQGQLVWQIEDMIGRPGAETVQALLQAAQMPGLGTFASILGLLTLLYGATLVVSELRDALNTIWCVPKPNETGLSSLITILRDRGFSLLVVVGAGFLLLVSLAVNAALSALSDRYHYFLPAQAVLLQLMDFAVSFLVITALFAAMYKVLPDLDLEWRDVIPGAIATSLLFGVGKTLIGMYLGKATVASAYGAAGSLVVLLLWVYYSAQIFFLGAEFTQVYAQTYGSRPCDRVGLRVHAASTLSDIDTPEADDKGGDEPLVKLS